MIGQLRGELISKRNDAVLIDVGGVGYLVTVPASTHHKLPPEGGTVELKIYTHVREDQLQLFGFWSEGEKEIFLTLLSVNGIGPKMALTIVSEMSPGDLKQTILSGNLERLTSISGIGRKTGERIILEMKEKIQKLSLVVKDWQSTDSLSEIDALKDLMSALLNLGYKQNEIERVVSNLKPKVTKESTFEILLKQALKLLRG